MGYIKKILRRVGVALYKMGSLPGPPLGQPIGQPPAGFKMVDSCSGAWWHGVDADPEYHKLCKERGIDWRTNKPINQNG